MPYLKLYFSFLYRDSDKKTNNSVNTKRTIVAIGLLICTLEQLKKHVYLTGSHHAMTPVLLRLLTIKRLGGIRIKLVYIH